MRHARKDRITAEIKVVRDLQRLSADARASKASALLQLKQDVLDHEVDEQHDLEQRWETVVSQTSFAVDMSRLWSAALLNQDVRVRLAQRDVDLAAEQLERHLSELNAAAKRQEEAHQKARKAASAALVRRDESRLAEVLDRHALRRVVT